MPSPKPLRSALLASAALLLGAAAGAQTSPIANAGPDQTLPCADAVAGAEVTLDGSASSDPDDPLAVLTYTWTSPSLAVPADGVMPVVTLPVGVHVITLSVDDGIDPVATDDVMVTVEADGEPPQLVLSTSALELWPPNHKYRSIDLADVVGSVTDTCDTELGTDRVVFDRGTSDEADDANGDGSTTGDILFGEGCTTAFVRSERAGPGDGRVYELVLSVQDAAGNAAEAVLSVAVPHDRAHEATDSGDAFEVLGGECGPIELCPAEPSDACEDAGDAKVVLRDDARKGASLRWRASGFAAAEGEFDDESTDYQLCVYTDDGVTAVLTDDPAAPSGSGWKHHRGGASFRGKKGGPFAGLGSVKLRSKKGKGALSVAADGDDLGLPTLPLAQGTALTLQLVDSEGECLESSVDSPDVNEDDHFEGEDSD